MGKKQVTYFFSNVIFLKKKVYHPFSLAHLKLFMKFGAKIRFFFEVMASPFIVGFRV